MERKYKNEILGIIHQNQSANLEVGAITEKQMQKWDKICLIPEPVPLVSGNQTAYSPTASPLNAVASPDNG
jgi:DNA-binding transcriptional regulator YiaG